MSDFVYLYVHTCFGSGGGPASPEEWCRRAAELGYKALGVSDRAPMAAFPDLSIAARRAGLSPIYGVEFDLALPPEGSPGAERVLQPVALFARDEDGLRNLSRLSALAYAGWPSAEQPLSWDSLVTHATGLALVLSGCVEGGNLSPVARIEDLAEWVGGLKAHFAQAFIGLPPAAGSEDDAQSRVAQAAATLGLPMIALPAARYLRDEDASAYRALRAARRHAGWAVDAAAGEAESAHESLRSPAEAAGLFEQWPEAVENLKSIVELCVSGVKGFGPGAGYGSKPEVEGLKSRVEGRLSQILGAEELSNELRERLDAEPAWVELEIDVPGTRHKEILESLVNEWGSERIVLASCHLDITPLPALQAAGGVLSASDADLAALWSGARDGGWNALLNASESAGSAGEAASLALSLRGAPIFFKPDLGTLAILPGGDAPYPLLSGEGSIQNPKSKIQNPSGEGGACRWLPWARDALCECGYATLRIQPSSALSVLDAALNLATQYPTPGFTQAQTDVNLGEHSTLSEEAAKLLKKGEVVGIPYLSSATLKGWEGDFSEESLAALVARSMWSGDHPKAPEGVAAWAEHTGDTGGALLYFDQFDKIAEQAAGIAPRGAAVLRLAMLDPETDLNGALKARFVAGCGQTGLGEEEADALWKALAACAPGLISRHAAHAWGRVSLRLAALKVSHPAAFLAAALNVAWGRGGCVLVPPLAEEAGRLKVGLLPPDAGRSLAAPTLEQTGTEWGIRWGLAALPGWDRHLAERFVEARTRMNWAGFLPDLARLAVEAQLQPAQVEALVRAGACDALGEREALLEALPSVLESARRQDGTAQPSEISSLAAGDTPISPRQRFARRTWEEQSLGVRFTEASAMDELRRAVGESAGLGSGQTTTAQIGPAQVGQSVCLVGLLHEVGLLEGPEGDGQRMAVAWVEDPDGAIELVAFPPNYNRHAGLWAENNLVIITARVCSHPDGDGVYLLCEHLAAYHVGVEQEEINITVKPGRRSATAPLPTPAARSGDGGSSNPYATTRPSQPADQITAELGEPPAYHLIITLPGSDDDHDDIDRMIALDKVLKVHPGPDRVTLRIPYSPETGSVTSAQLSRGVRYTSVLEEEIRGLLGSEALALIRLLG